MYDRKSKTYRTIFKAGLIVCLFYLVDFLILYIGSYSFVYTCIQIKHIYRIINLTILDLCHFWVFLS
jgi:hypothetical protein